MEICVSDDIKAVIDWEVAHGNAVQAVYYPFGLPVVGMKRPVRQWHEGVLREVGAALKWWEFRDCHYGEEEWCAGFESTESGHKIAGPLR